MPLWTSIIIHDSATVGNEYLPDIESIRSFHMQYRQNNTVISEAAYQEKRDNKEPGLFSPFKEIGYHWVVQRDKDGLPLIVQGRSMMLFGNHAPENGMNRKAIGIVICGNYNYYPPEENMQEKAADLTAWLCRMYRIPVEQVFGHHHFAPYDSCPGSKFDMPYFKERVAESLKLWLPGKNTEK